MIDSKDGVATYWGAKNEKAWTIHWAKGATAMPSHAGNQMQAGRMEDVDGQIFKNETVACTFRAKHGIADKSTHILVLTDNVQVVAQNPKATLFCDELTYDGNRKFFKAHGHVRILGTMGTVGTLEEVWATPHLDKVASPDMFDQP